MDFRTHVTAPIVAVVVALSTLTLVSLPSQVNADTGCATAVAPTVLNGFHEVDTAAKLQWVKDSGSVSASYKVTANIDLSGCTWSHGIGSSASRFSGVFDGNGKTISNLTISGGNTQNLGLIDYLTGTVTDLTLASPSVTGTNTYLGAVAGQVGATGIISNVTATSLSVSGTSYLGGIVGTSESGSTLSNITASGTVTSTVNNAGGIVGSTQGSLTNVVSSVDVNGNSNSGGLVGTISNSGSITDSTSTGNVTATGATGVGGAVGFAAGTRPNCPILTGVRTTGNIDASQYVGGLVGYGNCYFINRSSSSSTVTATSSFAGGIVGYDNYPGNIDTSFFNGSVQATEGVGGIGGLLRSVISNVFSTGSVTATSATNGGRAGGLVGWFRNSGVVGQPNASITNSYASGLVTPPASDTKTGGLVGDYGSGTITASVWNTTTTTRATSAGTGARGYTSQQLRNYVLYDADNLNWSITDGISTGNGISTGTTWSVCSGAASGLPFLTWQGVTGTCQPTMAYNGNGNTGGTAPADASTPYASGSTVSVVGNTGSLTKTANIFTGWNTKSDGSGTPYVAGDTFAITSPTMLFAMWSTSPTIRYWSNGGVGSITSQSGATSSSVVLSNGSNFSRTNYILSRWDTSLLGTGTSYALGQATTMPANGLNLFAVWTLDPSVTTTTTTTTTPPPTTTTTQPSVLSPSTSSPASLPAASPVGQNPGPSQSSSGSGTTPGANPEQDNATTTTAPAEANEEDPSPDDTAAVPDLENVEENEAGATIGGRVVSSQISYNNGNVVVSAGGAIVEYTIIDPAGTQRILSEATPAIVQPGDTVGVRFSKFVNNAEVSTWIMPGDLPIGSTTLTGGQGSINGVISQEITAGIRRIITVTETENNERFVVALGVEVVDTDDSNSSWSLVFLIFVGIAVAGALLIPAVQRRRESDN